jgi:hypothetical protein
VLSFIPGRLAVSSLAGPRDAHVFKMLAYAAAGVQVPAYGRYPPRQITVMTRNVSGRTATGACGRHEAEDDK